MSITDDTTDAAALAAASASTDPGLEVVDLGDLAHDVDLELDAAIPFDLTEKAKAFAGLPVVNMARRTGFAADYEWATWLPDVLRAAGLKVVEYPGWKTRGRPRTAGPFTPRGVIWHHDASAKGPSPRSAEFIAERGRPDDGIPAPLSQCWVALDGTWWVLAAGRANHAGYGSGWGSIGRDMGNTATIGVETDNTCGEATPPAMLDSLVRGTAAILKYLHTRPEDWLAGHKEYAAGRKIDPDDIDMPKARRDVAEAMRGKPTAPPKPAPDPSPGTPGRDYPFPGYDHFREGHKCGQVYSDKLKDWLNETTKGPRLSGPLITKATLRRVEAFQAAHPKRCKGDQPGVVGKKTWIALQHVARIKAGE